MQIERIAVIGAGPLGRAIACLAARAGLATVLEDVNSETLDSALAAIRARVDSAIAASEITRQEGDAVFDRISTSRSIEDAMRAAEFIIDTTIDELETKLEVFTIFDKFALPGAILASCTASLSVADIATITFRAERCFGMRFAMSESKLKRVEIIRSTRNAVDAVETCVHVARRLGLDETIVSDTMGAMREGKN